MLTAGQPALPLLLAEMPPCPCPCAQQRDCLCPLAALWLLSSPQRRMCVPSRNRSSLLHR